LITEHPIPLGKPNFTMVQLTVPESGLTLPHTPTFTNDSDTESQPLQIMQLDLAEGILKEIFKNSRHGGKGVNITFGKSIVRYSLFTICGLPFTS